MVPNDNSTTVITPALLAEGLGQLVGLSAWRSRAGNGTGSIFTLQFGPALADDNSQGTFSIMVYCAWRITLGRQLVCSWHDDSDAVLAVKLQQLEGSSVTAIRLSEWGDLTVGFSNGKELQILNDFSPHMDFDHSWFIIHRGKVIYAVNTDGSLTREDRDEDA